MADHQKQCQDCQICADKFNKSTKKRIQCLFCNEICCKECILGNLKINWDSNPDHCIFCKGSWDLSFWYENFYKKEIDEYFRGMLHKKAIDSQRAMLPEFQELARNYKILDVNREQIQEKTNKVRQLKLEIEELQKDIRILTTQNHEIQIMIYDNNFEENKGTAYSIQCPNENCKFMLTNDFQCENCNVQYCSDCLEIYENEEHTCDKDTLETIKHIKKNSKPCPGCGTSISKIDGCDQMWCIICKKGFSWRTGKIETGRIHNPEYFRWIQEHGEPEQEEYQVPVRHNNCVFPDFNYFFGTISLVFSKPRFIQMTKDEADAFSSYFTNALRFGLHLENRIHSNETANGWRNSKLRSGGAKFLNNQITETEWKTLIKNEENAMLKSRDITNIEQLVKIVLLENIWRLIDEFNNDTISKNTCYEVKSKLDKISEYANQVYTKLASSKMHGGPRLVIKEGWTHF